MKPSTLRMLFVLGAAHLPACTADDARFPDGGPFDPFDPLEPVADAREPTAPDGAFADPSGPQDPDGIYDPTSFDNTAHPAVTVLEWKQGFEANGCTGTLIASNVVLTAAHCFEADVNQHSFDVHVMIGHNANQALRDDLLEVPGIDNYSAAVGSLPATPTVTGSAANVITHPLYVFGGDFATWDVALVVLDTPVPEHLITPLPVLAAGLLPSPPLSASFSGLDKWNGIYVEALGGGNTNAGCDDGAFSPIARLDVEMFAPDFADGGPYFQMSGSQNNAGPAICYGDSGGPIVTSPNGQFGTNLPNFEIVSLSSKDPGVIQGPVLNGVLRGWLVANALDADGDGLEPGVDNCDDVHNPNQADNDGDGWGDDCDNDDDNDGIFDQDDNCPDHDNPDQIDWDEDGIGWACDPNEHDLDGDHVPNADDNCPWHANPSQENCNELAEQLNFASSDGTVLGDACDPVPCATTYVQERYFEAASLQPWSVPGHICIAELGRAIEDVIDIRPMRGSDYDPVATNDLEVWFCPCEENDATACEDPPWNCELAPDAATQPGSRWLSVSLTDVFDKEVAVAQPLSTVFQPWVQYPQPSQLLGWDYLADYDNWVVQQQIWTPTPNPSGPYGSGTDMRGLLWVEDPNTLGLAEHGVELCIGGCSMSSRYIADVQPDRATTRLHCKKIPETKPPPWWTYCPECLDIFKLPYEHLVNPPVLTMLGMHAILWTMPTDGEVGAMPGGGLDVTAAFNEDVLSIMSEPDAFAVVGPSEPVDAALAPGQARAFVLARDASAVVGQLALGEEGFELRSWDVEAPMTPRTGFAAAYSLGEHALFLAGGSTDGEPVADAWRLDADGSWSALELDVDVAPRQAMASVWSSGDGHVWVVDAYDEQGRLLRIDPATGQGAAAELDVLAEASEAWLVQLATHELLLVTSHGESHRVTMLSGSEEGITTLGTLEAEGRVVAPPVVEHGTLVVGLARDDEEQAWIEPVAVDLEVLEG